MWGEHGPRPTPSSSMTGVLGSWSVTASIDVRCDARSAWSLLTDVARIGEFSPECIAASWADDAPPGVGSRFDGTNLTTATGPDGPYEFEWTRPCVVTAWERPRRFAYTVGDRYDGTPATEWEFVIESVSEGCVVTQTFRHLPDGLSGPRHWVEAHPSNADQIIASRTADIERGMHATLSAMKGVLESA